PGGTPAGESSRRATGPRRCASCPRSPPCPPILLPPPLAVLDFLPTVPALAAAAGTVSLANLPASVLPPALHFARAWRNVPAMSDTAWITASAGQFSYLCLSRLG